MYFKFKTADHLQVGDVIAHENMNKEFILAGKVNSVNIPKAPYSQVTLVIQHPTKGTEIKQVAADENFFVIRDTE